MALLERTVRKRKSFEPNNSHGASLRQQFAVLEGLPTAAIATAATAGENNRNVDTSVSKKVALRQKFDASAA